MGLEAEIAQMREQGVPDMMIADELKKKGYPTEQVTLALFAHDDVASHMPSMPPPQMGAAMGQPMQQPSMRSAPSVAEGPAFYNRIEEIAEGIIDEKWDELLTEVKKIIAWKEKVEQRQQKIEHDLAALKENFDLLHKGVLGRLDTYDQRMQDVNVELKAVGKVFNDVVPEFVENVKELSAITKKVKKK